MKTDIVRAESAGAISVAVEKAVSALRAGTIVAVPTETVYGLAADALNTDASLKIFEAKERPRFDPLIVHLPDAGWLPRVARIDRNSADGAIMEKLIEAFWPGPLTLILPRRDVPDVVTAGLDTVAVRVSAHPLFARIVAAFGSPVAAPSANRFGRVSPTDAKAVAAELDGRIPLIIDGGQTLHGVESTIVRVHDGRLELLRHGPVTMEQLSAFAPVKVAEPGERPVAPGQLASHYAPATPLVLVQSADTFVIPRNGKAGALCYERKPKTGYAAVRVLSPSGDLREAAVNLFRCLRELDEARLELIVAEEVPAEGVGAAIMERLRRAATRGSAVVGKPP